MHVNMTLRESGGAAGNALPQRCCSVQNTRTHVIVFQTADRVKFFLLSRVSND